MYFAGAGDWTGKSKSIRKILVLAADGRRRAQTFSSADLAEENRLALRAGEMIRARGSAGEL
jgi:hypothetical protein